VAEFFGNFNEALGQYPYTEASTSAGNLASWN